MTGGTSPTPASFTLTWEVGDGGWALCTVGELRMAASYLTDVPRDLITAVVRLHTGHTEQRLRFYDEPKP